MLINEQMEQIEKFSSNEQIIIEYIQKMGVEINSLSARKIANETLTSASTVVRLCKKFGCKGFEDFKKTYIHELRYLTSIQENINKNIPFTEKDNKYKIANNLSLLYQEIAKDTLECLSIENLSKATQMILKADNIYIFSSGSSINLAKIFQERMLRITKTVVLYESLDMQYIRSVSSQKKDCYILLSYSGEVTRIVRVAQTLKRQGVPTIAITSLGNNRLSKIADCVLNVSTREKIIYNICNYSSLISTGLILDILYSCCFNENYQKNLEYKIELEKRYELQRQKYSQKNIL
ncbi:MULTISPECIES: MurR/RpiR family transcriptional regulator [Clostridium]|uniref:MurR/RpiR family transcriptional regulator n=1 Tax=Clostridium TaxID=1485 RepID=UPI000825E13F|nr:MULTISPECIES: MurR/RpiR family transcriptional regulator [Clostridium]PJI07430.1 MurR/RpiR family transcriptional regulator [Clostridium sp. CT7]